MRSKPVLSITLFALVAMASGCSFAIRAEILNPLNKGGREETSKPVAPPAPSPSASPTPGGAQ